MMLHNLIDLLDDNAAFAVISACLFSDSVSVQGRANAIALAREKAAINHLFNTRVSGEAGSAIAHVSGHPGEEQALLVMSFNAQSRVDHLLLFQAGPAAALDTPPTAVPTSPTTVEEKVFDYLTKLESGEMMAAARMFAPEARYNHPPRNAEIQRGTAEGRDAIESSFKARGINNARHHKISVVPTTRADAQAVLGYVTGLANDSEAGFVSIASLDRESLICSYTTFMCGLELPLFERLCQTNRTDR